MKSMLPWIQLFVALLPISDCIDCAEFTSPMALNTTGTSVGTIVLPPSGSTYKSNQRCEWLLTTGLTDYGIRLDVETCMMQGPDFKGDCNSDYVDIYDSRKGGPDFIGRFCGSNTGNSYVTASSGMIVRFISDASLELKGFVARYQAVPLGPSPQQQEEDKRILDMAVGIPVGLLSMTVVVVASIFLIRYCQRRNNTRSSNSPHNAHSHSLSGPAMGLPGGYLPPDHSYPGPDSNRRNNRNTRGNNGRLPPYSVDAATPGGSGAPWGRRGERSTTPPPAYDSIDFGFSDLSQSGFPLSPPPYEQIVKEEVPPIL